MADKYDVVIIGGGPGGYNCAIRCGQLGLKVACIESRKTLGGTCLNVGCIPSKALLHASEIYEGAKNEFEGLGVEYEGLSLNLGQMMKQKSEAVDGLTKGVEFLFKKNKVDWIKGKGAVAGKGKVSVKGDDGEKTLEAKHIVIATGSEVTPLPGVEIDGERIVTSDQAIALDNVPDKLVVVGAGIIGLELGSVWRRLGAEVTVVEYLDRILPGVDSELAKTAQRTFKKQGIEFKLGQKVTGVEKGKRLSVNIELAKGGDKETIEADTVLVAIGRRPFTEGLGLDKAGVKTDERGFIVNDGLKTSVENIWVIGDCTTGAMLAHKAEEEGVAAAELIAGQPGHVDHNLIPGVVYTNPEIAWVGKTEDQLKEEGVDYAVGKFPMQANSRARTNHTTEGMVKVLADKKTDTVLGVHLICVGAGELVAEAALAMSFGAASEDIARTCHAHPTMSEAVRQAAMGVEGWTMQA
ncbi:MAG: dihydrolipoyl dehydrogenase [Euryhalocaulis sp.]|uniref:dihydrolipoyl dehydrogenase n=1 Tax=Euryhalocaulis sp. TaxID=2744307 RepID=UPI0017D7B754|nr:dihydrolipoyl dehydrogenase [Euryhalocaulis sp.]MBA4801744.1 dihydrolipoyl dehydrogenase [Euryhalocaulis sp.]